MEMRSIGLPIEIPTGEAGQRDSGRLLARLSKVRGVKEASVNNSRDTLRLVFDPGVFSVGRLEEELRVHHIRLRVPIGRCHFLLERLDSLETASAIEETLNAQPNVFLAGVNFAASRACVETFGPIEPVRMINRMARYGVSARLLDPATIDTRPRSFLAIRLLDAFALLLALLFWTGGVVAETRSLPLPRFSNFALSPFLFGASGLFSGWRPLCAALRSLRGRSAERYAWLLALLFAGAAATGRWREASAALILLRGGELGQAALLTFLRARIFDPKNPMQDPFGAKDAGRFPTRVCENLAASLARPAPYTTLLSGPSLRWFALVGLTASVAIVGPTVFTPKDADSLWGVWAYRGLTLLPLAMPEVFFLAASVAVAVALSDAARYGLLLRSGAALRSLARVRAAAYAKTGLLTQGIPVIEDTVPYYGWTCADVLRVALSLQTDPAHPLARALRETASSVANAMPAASAMDGMVSEGAGVAGTVERIRFFLGSRRWMLQNRVPMMRQADEAIAAAEAQGLSVILLGVEGGLLGLIVARDLPRPDVSRAVHSLKRLGLARQILLSGDGRRIVLPLAQAVGLDGGEGDLAESERAERIAELRAQTRRGRVVAVGAGMEDALLMDAADIGFGIGADVNPGVLRYADAAARAEELIALPLAIRLARRMDAALFRVWRFALLVKAALVAVALTLSLPLWATSSAEAALALLATGYLLLAVPVRARQAQAILSLPPVAPVPVVPAPSAPAPVPPEPEAEQTPLPLLELVFTCDPTADEEPVPDRVYPQWEPFIVPFYGETLRFGRKFPSLSLAVQVEDEGVSRLHGEVRLEANRPVLLDLKSSNGIRRNNAAPGALIPPETPVPLKFGDTLFVGRNTRIEVRTPRPAPES